MEYRRFGNHIVVRMDPGEEILEQVETIAKTENIKLATVSALGAINDFTIGVYEVDKQKYHKYDFIGDHEITGLTGTISTMDGEFYQHLHMTAAGMEGADVSGKLRQPSEKAQGTTARAAARFAAERAAKRAELAASRAERAAKLAVSTVDDTEGTTARALKKFSDEHEMDVKEAKELKAQGKAIPGTAAEVVGGHLNRAIVSATCEMVITVIDGEVDRVKDENVGLNVFKFD